MPLAFEFSRQKLCDLLFMQSTIWLWIQNTAIFGAKIHIHEVRANSATVPGKIKAVVPDTVGGVEKLFGLFLADICTNIL